MRHMRFLGTKFNKRYLVCGVCFGDATRVSGYLASLRQEYKPLLFTGEREDSSSHPAMTYKHICIQIYVCIQIYIYL